MDPNKEKVLYHLIFATNSLHGIEVFKNAEMDASEAQDEMRHEKLIEKTRQTSFMFGGLPPQSPKVFRLKQHHGHRARQKIIGILVQGVNSLPYTKLYGEAMAFPLVSPRDLQTWISDLENKGAIRICWDGTKRKVLSWKTNDTIVIIDKELLR